MGGAFWLNGAGEELIGVPPRGSAADNLLTSCGE